MKKARQRLILDFPFFANLFMNLEIKEDQTVDVACTDGQAMWYNPINFNDYNLSEKVFLLLHETMHIIFFHHEREQGRDPELFNVACDFVVNAFLSEIDKISIPNDALFSFKFRGMSVEEVYEELKTQNQNQIQVQI